MKADKSENSVERIYSALRRMAANFEFKPDARVNESKLAVQLSASRTPLREALNRLTAEGFFTFESGQGFFCRPLSPDRIMDLYETRVALETELTRLACRKTSDAELAALNAFWSDQEKTYENSGDIEGVLALDETFHMRIAEASGNRELVRQLDNLNARIRYVRMIDLRALRAGDSGEQDGPTAHRQILDAILNRDADTAAALMRSHIERRLEEATEAVRVAYTQLYVPDF